MGGAQLSHLEIVVDDLGPMEHFYTGLLGFGVTDRSVRTGDGEMVFLSQDPEEHHQVVLRQAERGSQSNTLLDHVAFRTASLADLRIFHEEAMEAGVDNIETVSHGSTWSVYVRDPEANRVEFFVDTPWPVAQPCRFEIDLSLSDADLVDSTEANLRELGLLTN